MAAELSPERVLITGANRGLGLEFVKQFVTLPKPPELLFAACRSPDSAQVCYHYNSFVKTSIFISNRL